MKASLSFVTSLLLACAVILFAVHPEEARSQTLDDVVHRISVIFHPSAITGPPYVNSEGQAVIPTAQSNKVLPTIARVFSLTPGFAPESSEQWDAGPWIFDVMSLDSPQQLLADIASIPEVYFAEYTEYDDPSNPAPLVGETAKSWFPLEATDAFCRLQNYLNSPWPDEEPFPTLLEAGLDECEWHYLAGGALKRDMDLPQAWGITRGLDDVVVAVIDTGVDWLHPELGGDGIPEGGATLEELLNSYNDGSIFRNWREEIGDANNDTYCGVQGVDDDLDGTVDEDPNGFVHGNLPEPDLVSGVWTSVDTFSLTDATANWVTNQFVNATVWGNTDDNPTLCDTIVANDATTIWVTRIPGSICAAGANIVTYGGLPGWIAATSVGTAYQFANGLDDDGDGVADDRGYDPTDDDENGFSDDLHGWDFASSSYEFGTRTTGSPDARSELWSEYGHGTQVASVLGALAHDDGTGIVGVAPEIKILPLRSIAPGGEGATTDNAQAIEYARGLKYADGSRVVDIIVMAQGRPLCDPGTTYSCGEILDTTFLPTGEEVYTNPTIRQLAWAMEDGIVVVNGAGNTNCAQAEPVWWNCLDGIITVAGVLGNDRHWENVGTPDGSSWGPWVDISARAQNIVAADPCLPGAACGGCGLPDQEHGYLCNRWGTSLASPQVGGVLALMLSANPALSADELRDKLIASVDTVNYNGNEEKRGLMGSGRVNAYKALTVWGNIPAANPDTTWVGDVWVSGDVHVPAGKRLHISSGTTVHVAQDDILDRDGNPTQISFEIEGSLSALGFAGMEINFECFSDSADSLFGSIVVVPGDPNQSIVVNETQFQDLELDELLAPNGGEQFVLGGNVNVTWSTDHVESWHSPALAVVDLVDLYYSTDDGINWTVEAAGLDAATGSHSFVAGTSHTALQARIKVVFRHSSGIVFGEDVSNASFQVDDPAVFSNESANVNFLWAGDPYASIAADLDGDGD
jgi:subtilisin family serine protease